MPTKSISARQYRKPLHANEKAFERYFAQLCATQGCVYMKIGDIIPTKARIALMKQRGYSDEAKKPFDGILVTPNGNYCIEMKYNYNSLEQHQADNQSRINKINGSFFVIRNRGDFYYLEQNGKPFDKTNNLLDIINLLITIGG